ncbi:KTSC domain-containing protein [Candidatus Symbiopectobacterium sp. NZEC127]|uniref:KTSC domain-containing protein n=1 Tax=Candidatus Symbiopectobacterium sp. NZEC127 TaxID=2820472 RepID=UPI002227585A|nr:KTSC domain-containing protein [Candidatus Symbiopectobacterium sp. NZEC127]MCW2484832.1 KTSC domain-containing protein [Candidatus Symbiopectobacterium sp. NZEC127]
MIRQPVASSNLQSVGYDAVIHTLEIAFRSGGIYHYLGVPDIVYQTLMSAPSKGRYFDRAIKNRYATRRIR